MIINTGCRTDIPAYYSEWFCNRIKEGYVLVRNPYFSTQVSKYKLTPDVVDVLCFCTKNPEPMLERIEEIKQFGQFWFVTITPYGKEIEPYVPEKQQVIKSLRKLSETVGNNSVSWRYDPIFISEKYDLDFHIAAFEEMAKSLSGFVNCCIISFIDLYEKTKRNFPKVRAVTKKERETIAENFVRIGQNYNIAIRSCCEGDDLVKYGVSSLGCMTKEVLERAIGCSLDIPRKEQPAREACQCLLNHDIGVYNTCGHGCIYCYANYNRETVERNMKLHDPNAPFLIGSLHKEDTIKEARQESWVNGQLVLDLF